MKKTSKFFATGDESSEEDERSEREDEEEQKAPVKANANRFARAAGFQSDSDDDSKKRVVKSQKDKKEEELTATIQALKNHLKINDWKETLSDFEKLNKQVQKEAEVPASYIKTLIQLEDAVKKTSENVDAKKKMSATNSKSFNALKQKLKKNNKSYTDQIEEHRKGSGAAPATSTTAEGSDAEDKAEEGGSDEEAKEASDAAEDEEEDEEEEPEEEEKPREPRKPMGRAFWLKSTTEKEKEKDKDKEKSDSEAEDAAGSDSDTADKPAATGKSKWLKDTKAGDKTKPAAGGKKPAGKKGGKVDEEGAEAGDEAEVKEPITKKDDKKAPDEIKWTAELVDKRLVELQRRRGRKEVDKVHHAEEIEKLLERSFSPAQTLAIMVELVKAQFDVVAEEQRKTPSVDMWRKCYRNLARILALLRQHSTLTLDDSHDDDLEATANVVAVTAAVVTTLDAAATVDVAAGKDAAAAPATHVKVTGNLLGFLERLDDEFTRSLQLMDPHMAGYQQHLTDELLLVDLAENVKTYYDSLNLPKRSVRVSMRILEHYYYKTFPAGDKKPSEIAKEKEAARKAAAAASAASSVTASGAEDASKPAAAKEEAKPDADAAKKPIDPELVPRRDPFNLTASEASALQEKLAHQIYATGDERMKTRAVLCQIYQYSLHDRFFEARDMLLMSHLQDSVQHMEINTQILFNRTMVQMGLCAFRRGLVSEAHSCLAELYAGGRVVKEFLAQGTSTRFQDKNPEQEKAEKRRLVPHHMHINLEMLEAVHLISAMLLEVPNMAANAYDTRKKIISRMFRRLLESSDRQVFSGPPENVRESVVAAARSLFEGDVNRCTSLLLSLAAWNLLPNPDPVKAMLKRKIQEEGVRTWLFTNSRYYDSIGLDVLSQMFDLPQNAVHSIVSKMMINEELHASWDQPTNAILLHKVEPSRLQFLAIQLSEKIGVFVENNERVLDIRSGAYTGYRGDNKQGGQRQGGDGWVPQDKRRFQQGDRQHYQRGDGQGQGGGQYKGQYNRGQGGGDRRDGGMRQSSGGGQRSGGYQRPGGDGGGYGQRKRQ